MVSSRRGRRRIYWDACVWLNYINERPEKVVLDALLTDSGSDVGDIELISSTVSQVEVAFAASEQMGYALDPDVEAQIDSLWYNRRRSVTLVELNQLLAMDARALMREANVALRLKMNPLDSIHLATARRMNVTEFHTYDTELPRFSTHLGFPIVKPYISGGPPTPQFDMFAEGESEA